MRKAGMFIAIAAAVSGCGGEAPAARVASAEPAAPEPARLPIGEITSADIPALMAAAYANGVPETVADLGVVVLGERVVLLTGADNVEACADCTGSLSLFYLVRMETGFMLQEAFRDFRTSGSDGKFNRGIEIVQFYGDPPHAGFWDVAYETACAARTLTVTTFTEAGPRIVLEAPFGVDKGAESVAAKVIDPKPYQAEFAIEYQSAYDDFVAPYMFVNQSLRLTFPTPAWTRTAC